MPKDKYRRSLRVGETLFRQGETGDCAYVIESGQLEVFRGKNARRKVLALLGPGELVGEMAIIDHLPRTASAVARRPTRLRLITSEHLQVKVDAADPLVRVLLRMTLQRYRSVIAGKRGRGAAAGGEGRAALDRIRLAQQLEHALEHEQFQLHFQPIVRLRDGAVAGFEALVRWNHPTRGIVGPAGFVPMMEESGLIHRLGRWTLRRACAAIKRLNEHAGTPARAPLFVCVNLSGLELEGPEIVGHVTDALAQGGVPAHMLHLEITESALVNSLDFAMQNIGRCRALGVRVAVDDFGTGYSSLNYLRHFPVDLLKIDRSFVRPVRAEEDNRAILRTIRDLAQALGMAIVAEGVEEIGQARMLRELGLAYAQGYLFSRPLDLAAAAELLNDPWPWRFDRRLLGRPSRARLAAR